MERASSAEIVADTITAVPGRSLGASALSPNSTALHCAAFTTSSRTASSLSAKPAASAADFHGARLFQLGAGGLVQVDTVGLKAGPDAGLRSPHAHGAKPDDADVESAD